MIVKALFSSFWLFSYLFLSKPTMKTPMRGARSTAKITNGVLLSLPYCCAVLLGPHLTPLNYQYPLFHITVKSLNGKNFGLRFNPLVSQVETSWISNILNMRFHNSYVIFSDSAVLLKIDFFYNLLTKVSFLISDVKRRSWRSNGFHEYWSSC